jgi:predicted phosphoribosyltransferase
MAEIVFQDRTDAGRQLARSLEKYRSEKPVVAGLPRGGVIVAAEVAQGLDTDLDVVASRKIGAPEQPEFAIGAVASTGRELIDEATVSAMRLEANDIETLTEEARAEARRQMKHYRGHARLDLTGRTVILVDDGLATGWTARAAVEATREAGADKIVLAVPVGAPETVTAFEAWVDEVVCLAQPNYFRAVGLWYRDFGQNSDEEVLELLERHGAYNPNE